MHQAFVDECKHLQDMFTHLGYPSSLVNGIIDKCDYPPPPTQEAKTKPVTDETLRASILFKDQTSVNSVKKQMQDLSSKIGIDVRPVFTSKKLEHDLKLKKSSHVLSINTVLFIVIKVICAIQIMSDIRHAIYFNALLIIDILPLVVIRKMLMGTLTYSMRANFGCLKNAAQNGIAWSTIRPNSNTQNDSIKAKLFV